MAGAWTELMTSFTPSGTGWQDYDISTNKSVPKGAIAHIILANGNDAAARTLGVRTDGSSINRYIKIQEAEGGGNSVCSMFVKVDPTTGYIETYCDDTGGVTFYLTGYFLGPDFTELFETQGGSADTSYHDWNLNSLYSVPKGSVCQVICANYNDGAAASVAVRTNGSSIDRNINIGESESASAESTDSNSIVMCVKSNASDGIIEYRGGGASGTNVKYHLTGYFDSLMDYVEFANQVGAITTANTWTDWDLSSYLDYDGRVVDIICMTATTAATNTLGARRNGSSTTRTYVQKEAEDGMRAGTQMPTDTDGSGVLEIIGSDASNERTQAVGYFKAVYKFSVGDAVGASDTERVNKTIPIAQTVGASDTERVNKGVRINENLQSVDLSQTPAKTKLISEALALAEALRANKRIPLSDVMGLVDALTVPYRTLPINENVHAVDLDRVNKALDRVIEALTTSDSVKTPLRSLRATDAVVTSDLSRVNKALEIVTEALHATDVVARPWRSVLVPQSVGAADAIAIPSRTLPLTEAITVSDLSKLTLRVKRVIENLTLTEALRTPLRSVRVSDTATLADITVIPSRLKFVQEAIGLIDTVLLNKWFRFLEVIGLTEDIITEVLVTLVIINDSLTLADVAERSNRLMPLAEAVQLADLMAIPARTFIINDLVQAVEDLRLHKSIFVPDQARLTDIIIRNRKMPLAEAVHAIDMEIVDKLIVLTDSAHLADTVLNLKLLVIEELLTAQDLLRANKTLPLEESITLSETLYAMHRIIIAESVTLEDEIEKLVGLILRLVRLQGLLRSENVQANMDRQEVGGSEGEPRTEGDMEHIDIAGDMDHKELENREE